MVSWSLSFIIGFGAVGIFGLGYFLGNRADREKLKEKGIYIAWLESALGKLREIEQLKDFKIGLIEKELEDLTTAHNECFEAEKKVAASDIFRTPKGLLSFKKYVRE